jgi:hypothetical protein
MPTGKKYEFKRKEHCQDYNPQEDVVGKLDLGNPATRRYRDKNLPKEEFVDTRVVNKSFLSR